MPSHPVLRANDYANNYKERSAALGASIRLRLLGHSILLPTVITPFLTSRCARWPRRSKRYARAVGAKAPVLLAWRTGADAKLAKGTHTTTAYGRGLVHRLRG